MFAQNIFRAVLLLGLGIAISLFVGQSMAGERVVDMAGITVDSANRNADRIRQSQNRNTRDINRVNDNSW